MLARVWKGLNQLRPRSKVIRNLARNFLSYSLSDRVCLIFKKNNICDTLLYD